MTAALHEVQREITVRGAIYPRLVAQGRLSEEEARRRAAALADARQIVFQFYQAMQPTGQTSSPRPPGPPR